MTLPCNFSGFEVSPLSNTSLEIHLNGQVDLGWETNPQPVFIWSDIPAEAPKCERKVGPPGLWGVEVWTALGAQGLRASCHS